MDDSCSQLNRDEYYELEILNGGIHSDFAEIRHSHVAEHHRHFTKAESPCRFRFPSDFHWVIDLDQEVHTKKWRFTLSEVKDLRIRDVRFSDQIYDGSLVIGTIEARVSAFFFEEKIVPEVVNPEDSEFFKGGDNDDDTGTDGGKGPGGGEGPKPVPLGCGELLGGLFRVIGWIWIGLVFLNLVIHAWPLLLFFGAILLIGWIWPFLSRIVPWFSAGISLLFGLLVLALVIFSVREISEFKQDTVKAPQPVVDTSEPEPELRRNDGTILDYELIRREMMYRLPDGQVSRDTFAFFRQDLEASRDFRDHMPVQVNGVEMYNHVMSLLSEDGSTRLTSVFDTLDIIRKVHQLDHREFFELSLSWVQMIPYSVVLESGCIAELYHDPFITGYLDTSSQCIPQIRFGILTPLESLYLSKSDCDSKTLLLYTILKHFDYNVIVLSSELDRHSILGVELPYPGSRYNLLGHSFTLVETTDPNGIPGNLAPMVLPFQEWTINLLHLTPLRL